jgi:hypothetical protein
MNPLKCQCGCELRPTLKLEVLVGRLKRLMPGVEFTSGIDCERAINNEITIKLSRNLLLDAENTLANLKATKLRLGILIAEGEIIVNTSSESIKGVTYDTSINGT